MGVLVCGTGLGMALAASQVPGSPGGLGERVLLGRAWPGATTMPTSCAWAPGSSGPGRPSRSCGPGWPRTSRAGKYAERLEMMRGGYKDASDGSHRARRTQERRPRRYADLPLEQADPVIWRADQTGARVGSSDNIELIASENFTPRRRAPGGGERAHQQVRRGLSRQALLRRLRGGRRGRDSGHRAGQGPLRRRARQRAAPLRLHGQPGRLLRRAGAGRHASSP